MTNLPDSFHSPATLRALIITCLCVFAGACSVAPEKPESSAMVASGPAARKAGVEGKKIDVVDIAPVRPKIKLTGDLLYKILLAEFAGQRGRLDLALKNYMDLARSTQDPKIVERATRIAVYARNDKAATEAAKMWEKLDPLNPDPQQVLAVMALRNGKMEEALSHLQNILKYSHGELDQKMWMIANLLSREKNKDMIMTVMQRLVASRQDQPEALYAYAHVAARLGKLDKARELLKRTLELAPDNNSAAMSYIAILQRQNKTKAAINWLEKALKKKNSNDFNLRLTYAQLLTDVKRYDDARRQFEILAVQAPKNSDVLYALGLLYLQDDRLDDARKYFKRLVKLDENTNAANYYLGRIAEERDNLKKAGMYYKAVQGGNTYFDAQVRLGLIIARQGYIKEARKHLQSVHTEGMKQATILVQAEAELLMDQKRYKDAMEVYNKALDKQGFNAELLYSRAMLAEKMDRLDILERDLRRIIAKDPNHAQALNALGYTLADRTHRYDEAYALIKRALKIDPNDYYILDSMGWVLYREGKLDKAEHYLRKALSLRKDPEIAAHLGEVLWVKGDKEGAKKVWNTALQETPHDQKLQDVIHRFNP